MLKLENGGRRLVGEKNFESSDVLIDNISVVQQNIYLIDWVLGSLWRNLGRTTSPTGIQASCQLQDQGSLHLLVVDLEDCHDPRTVLGGPD